MTITVTITGETSLEVRQAMRQFAVDVEVTGPDTDEKVDATPVAPVEEQEPVKAKPKRRRRSKAEIQAEDLRNEAKADLSGADTIRKLLKEIEEKHGAVGIAKASSLMKVVLDDQGTEYERVKVSNVEEGRVWALVHDMKALLEEDAGE
jgi:hypothetical protein